MKAYPAPRSLGHEALQWQYDDWAAWVKRFHVEQDTVRYTDRWSLGIESLAWNDVETQIAVWRGRCVMFPRPWPGSYFSLFSRWVPACQERTTDKIAWLYTGGGWRTRPAKQGRSAWPRSPLEWH